LQVQFHPRLETTLLETWRELLSSRLANAAEQVLPSNPFVDLDAALDAILGLKRRFGQKARYLIASPVRHIARLAQQRNMFANLEFMLLHRVS
jgi:hypothetical protein